MGGVANEFLKSLKAAALNAQDAAFRYRFQTSNFQKARNSSKSNTSVELGPSPIELYHSSVADASKATEVQTEKGTVVRDELFQVCRSYFTVFDVKRANRASKQSPKPPAFITKGRSRKAHVHSTDLTKFQRASSYVQCLRTGMMGLQGSPLRVASTQHFLGRTYILCSLSQLVITRHNSYKQTYSKSQWRYAAR